MRFVVCAVFLCSIHVFTMDVPLVRDVQEAGDDAEASRYAPLAPLHDEEPKEREEIHYDDDIIRDLFGL